MWVLTLISLSTVLQAEWVYPQKQQKPQTSYPETFDFSVVTQWNWALIFVVAIIFLLSVVLWSDFQRSLSSSSSSSDMMWKLCAEVFLSPFFSLRCLLQKQLSMVLIILTNVLIKEWLRIPINLDFISLLDRIAMSLGNKAIFCSAPLCCKEFDLITCCCISLHYTTLEREFLIMLNINHEYIIMLACFTVFTVTN